MVADLFCEDYSNSLRVLQRNNAYKSAPYPCVGLFLFLELQMSRHPLYPTLLSQLSSTNGEYYLLDVGCGLGQDLRKLRYDGAQLQRIYAVELEQGLIDSGFDLFMDSNQSKQNFIAGDALRDDPSEWLKIFGIENGFNAVCVGHLFHLFDWSDQLLIAKNLISLTLKRENPVIFGWQYAARKSGLVSLGPNKEAQIYGHNEESKKKFWKEAGEVTGTQWSLQVECEWAESIKDAGLAKDGKWGDAGGNGLMWFSVQRI